MSKKTNKQTPSHIKETKKDKKVKTPKAKKVKVRTPKLNTQKDIAIGNANFIEYKKILDEYISTNSLEKFRLREDYFDVCQNYWLIDKYIARYGLYNKENPANTINAYNLAIEKGYPITISIQMLKDSTLVCFSEKSLTLLGTNGYLNNCTYDDIKDLKILNTDSTVPTLQEVLDTIDNKVEIILDVVNEIHCGKMEEMILNILSKYIDKHACHNRVALMSANPNSLAYFAENNPYITRILKVSNFKDKKYAGIDTKKLFKLKYYKESLADFIAYPTDRLPYWRLKHRKTRGVLAMSVKSQEEYMRVSRYCDNIIFSEFEPKI